MFCCLEPVSCRLAVATNCRLELQPVVTNIPKCASGLVKTMLQGKEKEKEADRRWEDNIKGSTGMDFTSSTRELQTGQDGKGLLRIHLCVATTFQGYGIE